MVIRKIASVKFFEIDDMNADVFFFTSLSSYMRFVGQDFYSNIKNAMFYINMKIFYNSPFWYVYTFITVPYTKQ